MGPEAAPDGSRALSRRPNPGGVAAGRPPHYSIRVAQPPTAFVERGPHPVGVATVQLTDPANADRKLDTDVWYPTAETRGEPASHPLSRPHEAVESATPVGGAFPLIAFSHGNSGLRRQSTFLTTHLASWGFVVAAPDHTGNTFFEMIQIQSEEERQQVHFDARRNRPSDIGAVIDAVVGGDGAWAGVDTERIGVLGHSYGGWTATKMPGRDPRISAVCASVNGRFGSLGTVPSYPSRFRPVFWTPTPHAMPR